MTVTDKEEQRRPKKPRYILDEQVGFILRQVSQRHGAIFSQFIGDDLTPTQWAALAKLAETGSCSQNQLGRLTAMDVATIKGVVDRLTRRGLIGTEADPTDGRRLLVTLTDEGRAVVARAEVAALEITRETLAPLSPDEQAVFLHLLKRLL